MPQIAKCGTQIFSLTHREIKDKYTASKLAFVKSWKGLVLRFGTDTHTHPKEDWCRITDGGEEKEARAGLG